ncbi:MAG: orotidine-5'-phosphate decarboxylase [Gemmatimonadetes bacterium]|nr:orotidine-5'-phosphate decarboxylase [Gemmatimonadota bacterium]
MAEIVVALDFPSPEEAFALAERLGARVRCYKVGLELFTRGGPDIVRELRSRGREVFLDLKIHDIPNTVAGAASAAAALGAAYLTVHALGGARMVGAARAAVEGAPTRILAVTVLTSLAADDLGKIPGTGPKAPAEEVLRLAALAMESGAHGVVASGGEVRAIRAQAGADALIVAPGIRLPGDAQDDQRRVFGPAEAVLAGADLLVVGRPITRAVDPSAAFDRIEAAMRPEMTEA